MTSPQLSIIIPTHKRAEILRECLARIDAQTIRDQLEVIVVSDGADAAASEVTRNKYQVPIKYFEIPKSHQGVARNRGVQEASADRVLFIGDDIFLAPDACEKHVIAHKKFSILNSQFSILGFTTWDPALEITPVMRWLEQSGWQFGYPFIGQYAHGIVPSSIQKNFTYTSHISVPTNIAKQIRFREDVKLYGWEDMEWGMRLAQAGVELFYEPDAKAFHHHHMTLEQSLKRMETLGTSAVQMEKLAPEMHIVPQGLKRMLYELAALIPGMTGMHRKAFLRGLRSS